MTVPTHPAVGDAVVIDHVKHRILVLGEQRAVCRLSFGGRRDREVLVADLTWDRVAGVWRVTQ